MPKARTYEEIEAELNLPPAIAPSFGDFHLVALPAETFKALTEEAAKRGLTFGQLFQKAIDDVLAKGKP